jgi:FtsZ-binding cell division protein ZapB
MSDTDLIAALKLEIRTLRERDDFYRQEMDRLVAENQALWESAQRNNNRVETAARRAVAKARMRSAGLCTKHAG